MKNLAFLAVTVLASCSKLAVASQISNTFDFHDSATFMYVADWPTSPGTDVTMLLTQPPPPFGPIPMSGFRDSTGAWSFTRAFATTSFRYVALTDTAFRNVPGDYVALPAQFITPYGPNLETQHRFIEAPGHAEVSTCLGETEG